MLPAHWNFFLNFALHDQPHYTIYFSSVIMVEQFSFFERIQQFRRFLHSVEFFFHYENRFRPCIALVNIEITMMVANPTIRALNRILNNDDLINIHHPCLTIQPLNNSLYLWPHLFMCVHLCSKSFTESCFEIIFYSQFSGCNRQDWSLAYSPLSTLISSKVIGLDKKLRLVHVT